MSTRRVDLVVVGAGVIGLSIAWRLAKAGDSCTVFDGRGIGSGMTAIQPGGIRTQWSSELACEMALESYDFYREIDARLQPGQDPAFDACGYVFAAAKPETLADLERGVELQNAKGIGSEMLGADEIAELVPGIDPSVTIGGVYNATDGYFDHPGAVATAFAEAAIRAGAQYEAKHVERIDRMADGWNVVLRGGDTMVASSVIVAAGAGSASLVAPHSDPVPLDSEPRYLFYSNRIRPFLVRPLVVFADEHFAVKHLADGSVLASNLSHGHDGSPDETAWRKEVTQTARRLVPLLEHVRYPVLVEGTYDVTPDQQPILGPVPGATGLYLAAGMNGRGMMMAPAIGRMMADAVANDDASAIPSELQISRFTSGRPTRGEARVI
ncbi:FAD-binding oxidoreductase [Nocardioidaceae bacterium SCSIO 66511]|nr:FAD-binding oxidoreductase [Nocardioidaceae bacterium SCSIO 66511]